MKLSNTKAALTKIRQRDELVLRLNGLLTKHYKVCLWSDATYSVEHNITEVVDVDAIIEAAAEAYRKRIGELTVELKELGVYIDTPDAIGADEFIKRF